MSSSSSSSDFCIVCYRYPSPPPDILLACNSPLPCTSNAFAWIQCPDCKRPHRLFASIKRLMEHCKREHPDTPLQTCRVCNVTTPINAECEISQNTVPMIPSNQPIPGLSFSSAAPLIGDIGIPSSPPQPSTPKGNVHRVNHHGTPYSSAYFGGGNFGSFHSSPFGSPYKGLADHSSSSSAARNIFGEYGGSAFDLAEKMTNNEDSFQGSPPQFPPHFDLKHHDEHALHEEEEQHVEQLDLNRVQPR